MTLLEPSTDATKRCPRGLDISAGDEGATHYGLQPRHIAEGNNKIMYTFSDYPSGFVAEVKPLFCLSFGFPGGG